MRRLLPGVLLISLALTAPAMAQDPIDVLETLKFTAKKVSSPSGLKLDVAQTPTPAGQQPPVVRRLVITLPKGAKIDTKALARCSASVAQVTADGLSACPAKTRLGTGTASVFAGSGNIAAKVTLFNRKNGFLLALTTGDTVIRAFTGTAKGRTIDATLPQVDLGGGKEASLVRLQLTVKKHTKGKRTFLRTPPTCPTSLFWRLIYAPTFNGDYGFETLEGLSGCRRRR